MNVKQGKSAISLYLKIPQWITISIESSWRDLFIDMVIDMFIFKNNQITLSPCFTVTFNTCAELPKTGLAFYCINPHDVMKGLIRVEQKGQKMQP